MTDNESPIDVRAVAWSALERLADRFKRLKGLTRAQVGRREFYTDKLHNAQTLEELRLIAEWMNSEAVSIDERMDYCKALVDVANFIEDRLGEAGDHGQDRGSAPA